MKYTKILALTGVLPLILSTGMITADTMTAEAAQAKPYVKTFTKAHYQVRDVKKCDKTKYNEAEWKYCMIPKTTKATLAVFPNATAKQALARQCAEIDQPAPKNDWAGVEKRAEDRMNKALNMGKKKYLQDAIDLDDRFKKAYEQTFKDGVPPIEYWIDKELSATDLKYDIYRVCNENWTNIFQIPNDPNYQLWTEGMTPKQIEAEMKKFCTKYNCA